MKICVFGFRCDIIKKDSEISVTIEDKVMIPMSYQEAGGRSDFNICNMAIEKSFDIGWSVEENGDFVFKEETF